MPDKVTISHRGAKYEIGRGRRCYGIWVIGAPPSDPIDRWPETREGWAQAWARFVAIERPGSIEAVDTPRSGLRLPGVRLKRDRTASPDSPDSPTGPAGPAVAGAVAGRRKPARATAAALLLGLGVVLGIIGLFPGYIGTQSLASQSYQFVPHLLYLVGWAASGILIVVGAGRARSAAGAARAEPLRLGALLGTGLSAVTFGLFLADLGEVIAGGGSSLLGTGIVLSLVGWLACAAGSVLALTARPYADELSAAASPAGPYATVSPVSPVSPAEPPNAVASPPAELTSTAAASAEAPSAEPPFADAASAVPPSAPVSPAPVPYAAGPSPAEVPYAAGPPFAGASYAGGPAYAAGPSYAVSRPGWLARHLGGGPVRPRLAEAGPLGLIVLAAIGTVAAFAPSWDSYTLTATTTGAVQTITAGNAFANPGWVIAGDVAVMIAVIAVAVLAALWRPGRQGALLLAGVTVPLVGQAISALLQVTVPTTAAELGISSAQASAVGLTITSGVTPIFWVYCVFVISLVVSCAWMLTAPQYPAMPAVPAVPGPAPLHPLQGMDDEDADSGEDAEDDEESTFA